MIERTLAQKLLTLAQKFPVITITGPRQSGKTTLVRATFPTLPYVSLEEPDIRQLALTDPRGFLSNFGDGAILDEVQRAPDLFSYIQSIVDSNRNAQFILSGSSNFLLMERVGQTLAGRSAALHLLPFSLPELQNGGFALTEYEQLLFNGQYPRIYDRQIAPADFYPSYIQTYVERDVRLLKNIADLNTFIQFTKLCAGRTGQLLNYNSLANDADISPNTVKAWLSVLEASYITYRLVKSPKLYFYDTGLACSLLGIRQVEQVSTHFLRGALFENLIINEFIKRGLNRGERNYPYFWQDNSGKEIDCLLEGQGVLTPVEIKSNKTMVANHFKNINYWRRLTGVDDGGGAVVYGGDNSMRTSNGQFVSWKDLGRIGVSA